MTELEVELAESIVAGLIIAFIVALFLHHWGTGRWWKKKE